MGKRIPRLGAALAAALVLTSPSWALELGDKAPELEVTGWAQGEPVTVAGGAGKSVFVVAFVSTIDKGCIPAMEAASKLQDKHRAKGLDVIAITTDSVDDAKKYLAEHKSSFRLAVDENRNTIASYAGDEPSLPFAVVVDKAGSIVFLGDPTQGMEKIVDDVVSGTFDLKKAVEVRKLTTELHEALRIDENDKADGLCDRIFELDPGNTYAFQRRCDGYERREDLEGYRKFVKAHLERVKDDAKALSAIAWKLVAEDRRNWRDPESAVVAARRSVDLGKSGDADALDTYAYVLAEIGLLEQAVEQQKKAVALDGSDEDYKRRLAFFESCLALKKRVQPPPPKKK